MHRHGRILLAAAAWTAGALAQMPALSVTFNGSAPAFVVDAHYLAVNLDTGSLYQGFDCTNAKLATLLRQLGPTTLRVGGTAADYVLYVPNATERGDGRGDVLLSEALWRSLLDLAKNSGNELLMDLNSLMFRNASNVFDPSRNASALLAYTATLPGLPPLSWSAGNEPVRRGAAAGR
jgi:hypothetical protein